MGDVLLPGGLGHNGTGCTPPSLWYEIPAVISLGLKFQVWIHQSEIILNIYLRSLPLLVSIACCLF